MREVLKSCAKTKTEAVQPPHVRRGEGGGVSTGFHQTGESGVDVTRPRQQWGHKTHRPPREKSAALLKNIRAEIGKILSKIFLQPQR